MYNLVGACTRSITSHEFDPIQHQLKNALYDIVQDCLQSPGYRNERLLEYLETLCQGADDKRESPCYGNAALLYASFVVDVFLQITTKTKEQVKGMTKGSWVAYKDLVIMRLTLIEEWKQEWKRRLSQLSESCQNAMRTSNGNNVPLVGMLKNLSRMVEADHPFDMSNCQTLAVKAEGVRVGF
jgi:hypothetical protein